MRGRGMRAAAVVIATGTALGVIAAAVPAAVASTGSTSPPTSVNAVAGSDSGEVAVTWVKPSDSSAVVGYVIQAATSGGPVCDTDCPAVLGADTQSFTYTGLTNGTSYTLIVYAQRSSGLTASTASSAVTPFTFPEAPIAPEAERTGSGSVSVTWSEPANNG